MGKPKVALPAPTHGDGHPGATQPPSPAAVLLIDVVDDGLLAE